MTKTSENGGYAARNNVSHQASHHRECFCAEVGTHHRHHLADGCVGDAELINDRWKDKRDAPASDAVSDPDHEKGYECRVLE